MKPQMKIDWLELLFLFVVGIGLLVTILVPFLPWLNQ